MEPSKAISLKLLIDTKNNRVLFAEAGKNAVDFLFHILTLPLGTLVRLLRKQKMPGCLTNLYESIENLNQTYIQPNQTKDVFLKPILSVGAAGLSPLFSLPDINLQKFEKTYYRCNNNTYGSCSGYFSDEPSAVCPACKCIMSRKIAYVTPTAEKQQNARGDGQVEGGFVKGVVTYMVMDDLVVKPMSTISSIALLNKFNVKEIGSLVEKEVDLGINEALNLLEASLASKTVLTTVFWKNIGKASD